MKSHEITQMALEAGITFTPVGDMEALKANSVNGDVKESNIPLQHLDSHASRYIKSWSLVTDFYEQAGATSGDPDCFLHQGRFRYHRNR